MRPIVAAALLLQQWRCSATALLLQRWHCGAAAAAMALRCYGAPMLRRCCYNDGIAAEIFIFFSTRQLQERK
jgi:hypothetical protein